MFTVHQISSLGLSCDGRGEKDLTLKLRPAAKRKTEKSFFERRVPVGSK
jgi:hypothetical protein